MLVFKKKKLLSNIIIFAFFSAFLMIISLYQHSGPEKRWLKSKMSKNRIETYLCDGKARK